MPASHLLPARHSAAARPPPPDAAHQEEQVGNKACSCASLHLDRRPFPQPWCPRAAVRRAHARSSLAAPASWGGIWCRACWRAGSTRRYASSTYEYRLMPTRALSMSWATSGARTMCAPRARVRNRYLWLGPARGRAACPGGSGRRRGGMCSAGERAGRRRHTCPPPTPNAAPGGWGHCTLTPPLLPRLVVAPHPRTRPHHPAPPNPLHTHPRPPTLAPIHTLIYSHPLILSSSSSPRHRCRIPRRNRGAHGRQREQPAAHVGRQHRWHGARDRRMRREESTGTGVHELGVGGL